MGCLHLAWWCDHWRNRRASRPVKGHPPTAVRHAAATLCHVHHMRAPHVPAQGMAMSAHVSVQHAGRRQADAATLVLGMLCTGEILTRCVHIAPMLGLGSIACSIPAEARYPSPQLSQLLRTSRRSLCYKITANLDLVSAFLISTIKKRGSSQSELQSTLDSFVS